MSEPRPHPNPTSGAAPGGPSKARPAEILIIDNDARIVELLAWFLSKRGFAVRSAGSFAEARALLAVWRPDLMLSDIDMGAENALEELPRMQADGCLPPTLVVSGYLDAPSTARLEALEPVLGTLAKPFDFQVLEERIVDLLARPTGNAPALVPATPRRVPLDVRASDAGALDEGWVEIAPLAPRRMVALPAASSPLAGEPRLS